MNPAGSGPQWLGDIQICHEFHLSEEEYDNTSLEWKRRAMVFLRGKARGEAQKARKEAAKNKR